MPGIVGIFSRNRQADHASALAEMVACQTREHFPSIGTYTNLEAGLWAGWAVRQGNLAVPQPFWNRTRDVGLIYFGEHVVGTDGSKGQASQESLSLSGSAAGLMERYEKVGLKSLEMLNGCFSGLLIDLRALKVVLFNDRYGLQRVYCHEAEFGFCFASEAKSILRVSPKARSFDLTGLGEHIACGCSMAERTLFSGVSLLPPGSAWTFAADGSVHKEVYFSREDWERQSVLGDDDYYRSLRDTFSRILPRYLQGEERRAVSVTGGIDSRLVMAWSGCRSGELPCYTFGGQFRESGDVRIGRRVAQVCGQSHETITVAGEFLGQFGDLASKTVWMSDGAMDVSGAAELYVNRQAREIAPVRLNGNYGSEILRRAVAFRPSPIAEWLFAPDLVRAAESAQKTYRRIAQEHPLSFIAFRQVPWFHQARFSIERSQLTPLSPFLDNELVALAYRSGASDEATLAILLRLVSDGNPDLARFGTDRGASSRAHPLLTKVQRLYQEVTFKAEYAYDYGMPQWLSRADQALRPLHLERLFLGRHKFCHFRIWYRDELSDYVREILLDPATRGRPFFQGASLEKMVRDHTSGARNHTKEIHQALSLELTARQLVDNHS